MNSQAVTQANSQMLLDIKDLRIWYRTTRGNAQAVDGVDLVINRNEVFGLAGESGCGKTTLARGILGMTKLPGFIESGEAIYYHPVSDSSVVGRDLLTLPAREMRQMRWRHIAYVPQGAMNVLSPVLRIEKQILDAIYEHSDMSKDEARARMLECMEMVGLEPTVARMYPHELSGGMKQRVTIAAAISLKPGLIIADEPTTALDVNVQQVILQELKDIAAQSGRDPHLCDPRYGGARRDGGPAGDHVLGADRRGGAGHRDLQGAPASLQPGFDRLDSHDRRGSLAHGGHSGQRAQPVGLAVGLPVPSALSEGDGDLPRAAAAHGGGGAGAIRGLSPIP